MTFGHYVRSYQHQRPQNTNAEIQRRVSLHFGSVKKERQPSQHTVKKINESGRHYEI